MQARAGELRKVLDTEEVVACCHLGSKLGAASHGVDAARGAVHQDQRLPLSRFLVVYQDVIDVCEGHGRAPGVGFGGNDTTRSLRRPGVKCVRPDGRYPGLTKRAWAATIGLYGITDSVLNSNRREDMPMSEPVYGSRVIKDLQGGQITLPADFRRALDIEEGPFLAVSLTEDGDLRMRAMLSQGSTKCLPCGFVRSLSM